MADTGPHGIDIEGSRFPPPGPTRPRNIFFSIMSILSLPDTWSNRFDLIHQRLLVCGLRRTDWPIALAEIHRALRPGGWVQLGEYNSNWGSGPYALKQIAVYEAIAEHRGQNIHVNKELPELLKNAGFVDVRVERRSLPLGAWGGERGKRAALQVVVPTPPDVVDEAPKTAMNVGVDPEGQAVQETDPPLIVPVEDVSSPVSAIPIQASHEVEEDKGETIEEFMSMPAAEGHAKQSRGGSSVSVPRDFYECSIVSEKPTELSEPARVSPRQLLTSPQHDEDLEKLQAEADTLVLEDSHEVDEHERPYVPDIELLPSSEQHTSVSQEEPDVAVEQTDASVQEPRGSFSALSMAAP